MRVWKCQTALRASVTVVTDGPRDRSTAWLQKRGPSGGCPGDRQEEPQRGDAAQGRGETGLAVGAPGA